MALAANPQEIKLDKEVRAAHGEMPSNAIQQNNLTPAGMDLILLLDVVNLWLLSKELGHLRGRTENWLNTKIG